MAFKKFTLACAVLVLLAVVNAEEEKKKIKCYVCDTDDSCNKYSEKDAIDCAEGNDKCFITGEEGKWRRGCTTGDYCKGQDEKLKCSTCDTDGCNSGTSLTASVLLSSVAFLLMKLYN